MAIPQVGGLHHRYERDVRDGLVGLSRRHHRTYDIPIELSGLYWHFVDIVWIFRFPLLYLVGRHVHG